MADKINYYQQAYQMLGGKAIQIDSNTSVTTASAWEVSVDANTTIIRVLAENSTVFLKYDGSATSTDWDYVIPFGGVLDIHEDLANANTISVIASTVDASVYVGQY